jgi:hypothetical protein
VFDELSLLVFEKLAKGIEVFFLHFILASTDVQSARGRILNGFQ